MAPQFLAQDLNLAYALDINKSFLFSNLRVGIYDIPKICLRKTLGES